MALGDRLTGDASFLKNNHKLHRERYFTLELASFWFLPIKIFIIFYKKIRFQLILVFLLKVICHRSTSNQIFSKASFVEIFFVWEDFFRGLLFFFLAIWLNFVKDTFIEVPVVATRKRFYLLFSLGGRSGKSAEWRQLTKWGIFGDCSCFRPITFPTSMCQLFYNRFATRPL